MSGKELDTLIQTLFGRTLQARHAHFLPFKDAQGEAIDEGIALFFKGPHSYTGEDVLELQGHGGPAVLRRLLDRCLEAGKDQGLRLAEPGEFTQRAFLNAVCGFTARSITGIVRSNRNITRSNWHDRLERHCASWRRTTPC